MVDKYLNRVHNVDIMHLLNDLPDNSIDMVYSDIDYNIGIKYGGVSFTKSFKSYIGYYSELAKECYRVLKDTGSAFFINFPRNNAFLWVNYLDEAFYDVQEYVWVYNTNIGHSPYRFTTAHRSILHCRKTNNSVFYKENVAQPYKNTNDGRIKRLIESGSKGRSPYSWFYADMVKKDTKKIKDITHPCVIPTDVSSLLIKSVTLPGDLVLILFAGSGSEVKVCKDLSRNFITADINPDYCDKINKELLS